MSAAVATKTLFSISSLESELYNINTIRTDGILLVVEGQKRKHVNSFIQANLIKHDDG